jgi:UDP-N-acetylglucosamine 1-carboxyvinyltransferase
VITETVYERRFKYVNELARMGGDCRIEANAAVITGVERLTGAPVAGSDLRATAALVLAGLAAVGQSEVSGLQYLDRGYEGFVEKLTGVGAELWRASVPDPAETLTWAAQSGGRVAPMPSLIEG